MWRLLSLLVLLAFSATEASGQEDRRPAALDGCYSVDLGEWRPALMEGNSVYQTPPDTVHLQEEIGGDTGSPFERGRRLARPVISEGRTPSAFWIHEEPSSVRVVWSNGHAGVRLNLVLNADQMLVGEAEAFTDVVGLTPPTAEVTLRKVECPGE